MRLAILPIILSPILIYLAPSSKKNLDHASTPEVSIEAKEDFNSLEGTWQLIAAKLAHTSAGESPEFSNESGVVSMKIFTRNRFVTLRYDRETHVLLGTGGGTYIQLGDQFTEYIDYHSWDSTLVDFPQNFTCTFEGDLFTQRGTIIGGNTDGQSLEEVYQRVEDPFSQMKGNYPLLGSWKLLKWANGDVEIPEVLPPGLHGFKIFTPTFFYAMRYRETGGISSFAFGTYRATPDYLTETVISLGDLSSVGKSYTFSWSKTDKGFKQYGFIDLGQFMGYKIEEYYQRE
jgi:hypothetical protein